MKTLTKSKNFDQMLHEARVHQEMVDCGVSKSSLWRMNSRYLPKLIHDDEHIGGVAYGHSKDGSVMLVATNRRILFLNKRPLTTNEDEISYDVVAGVSFGHVGLESSITLHTRIKDYSLKTFNENSAQKFVDYVGLNHLEDGELKGER